MCSRFSQSKPISYYQQELLLPWDGELEVSCPPTWNLAPSAPAWVFRLGERGPAPALLRWGFTGDIPSGSDDQINAEVETAIESNTFRKAWKHRRCLIPADGWYEWEGGDSSRRPFYFTRHDGHPVFFAGVWTANSFALFTMKADGNVATVFNRKPICLNIQRGFEWLLSPKGTNTLTQSSLTSDAFRFAPVSKRVNDWHNDNADLIHEIGSAELEISPRLAKI